MSWGNPKSEGGEQYIGLWHNDKRVKGWIKMADGTEYDGEWKDDVMHGWGRLTFKPDRKGDKGITYEGYFNKGM